jgi:hypothetical protein
LAATASGFAGKVERIINMRDNPQRVRLGTTTYEQIVIGCDHALIKFLRFLAFVIFIVLAGNLGLQLAKQRGGFGCEDRVWIAITFISICLAILVESVTLGVRIHEKAHVRGYRGTIYEKRVVAHYGKWGTGYVKVCGPIEPAAWKKATLMPLFQPAILLVVSIACAMGPWHVLTAAMLMWWWYVLSESLADTAWVWLTRSYRKDAKYWDRGRELHVVRRVTSNSSGQAEKSMERSSTHER